MLKEEFQKQLLKSSSDIMYHCTLGNLTEKKFFDQVKIFDTIDEYNKFEFENNCYVINTYTGAKMHRSSFGRTNLDGGFHGFYLTSSIKRAREWHKELPNKNKRILKFKVDIKKLLEMNCLIYGVPDEEWAWFIVKNRNKKLTRKNTVKCSFSIIADGYMSDIDSKIQNVRNKEDALELWNELIPEEYYYFYDLKNDVWNYDKILMNSKVISGYTMQLCINDMDILKECIIPISKGKQRRNGDYEKEEFKDCF